LHGSDYEDYSLLKVMPYSLVDHYRCFEGTCCLHLVVEDSSSLKRRWQVPPRTDNDLPDNMTEDSNLQCASMFMIDIAVIK
jgi:hypothetical protein